MTVAQSLPLSRYSFLVTSQIHSSSSFNHFFICLWLCWVFIFASGLSLVAESGGSSRVGERASHCSDFSLQSMGSRDEIQQLWLLGSRAQAQQLGHLGLVGLPWQLRSKESACSAKEQVQSQGLEDPLEQEFHSSILAWKIPWTEEPGVLPSMRSQRVGQN